MMDKQVKPEEKPKRPSTNNLVSKCAAYKEKILSYRRGIKVSDRIPNVIIEEKVLPSKQSQSYLSSPSPYSDKEKSLEFFNDQVLQAATKIADDLDGSIERYQRYSDYLKLQLSELTGDVEQFHRISSSFEKQKEGNKEVESWKDEVTTILEEMKRQQALLDELYQMNVKQPDPCETLDAQTTLHQITSTNIFPPPCPHWKEDPLGYIYCVWTR